MFVLIAHPIIQFTALILACYVFHLGYHRFSGVYLKQKVPFLWKRHVSLGAVALITFLAGMVGGIIVVYTYWRSYLITGLHAKVAITLLPLIVFGLVSGIIMNASRKKRKWLPILHGANNAIVLILALVQVFTGWKILRTYVLG